MKNLADFISNVIRQSEVNAKAIRATTVGTSPHHRRSLYVVVRIRSRGGPNAVHIYKTAIIDTIVAEVQSVQWS